MSASPHSTPHPFALVFLLSHSSLRLCYLNATRPASLQTASRVHLSFLQAPQHFGPISPALWHPLDHTPGKKKDHGKDMTHNHCRLKQACCGFSRPSWANTSWDLAKPPPPILVPIKATSRMFSLARQSVSGGGTAQSHLRLRLSPQPQVASAQACGGHGVEERGPPAVMVLSD